MTPSILKDLEIDQFADVKYKIESGIPVPSRKSALFDVAKRMNKGDSVKVSNYSEAMSLYAWLRKFGKKSSVRKENGYVRVWRIS